MSNHNPIQENKAFLLDCNGRLNFHTLKAHASMHTHIHKYTHLHNTLYNSYNARDARLNNTTQVTSYRNVVTLASATAKSMALCVNGHPCEIWYL